MVWSGLPANVVAPLLDEQRRLYQIIDNKHDLPSVGANVNLTVILDISVSNTISRPKNFLKSRHAAELENEIEGFSGLLVCAGTANQKWIEIVQALAPSATILLADWPSDIPKQDSEPLLWPSGLLDFFDKVEAHLQDRSSANAINLKDAPNVQLDPSRLGTLGDGWELLTREHTDKPSRITQEEFDEFLSSDPAWKAVSANVPYSRGAICQLQERQSERFRNVDPIEHTLQRIKELDRDEVDPTEAAKQIRIFAEAGSGCTTMLRQIAIAIAREGYPTLMTTPYPRELASDALGNLIIHIQESWVRTRHGRGSGSGNLPVCLVLDTDAELPSHFSKLLRSFSGDLHRKLLIVRAFRRSDAEMDNARDVLRLKAETNVQEILSLGAHLRTICVSNGLNAIPSDNEWRAFYEGFSRTRTHHANALSVSVDTPPLFLIGLHPFIKENVRDERSLGRYLYRKWSEITDEGTRQFVSILATAGAHGIAVPFEVLARDETLHGALFNTLSKEDSRHADFFIRWVKFGWLKRNWAVYIRHPALGHLLARILRPIEADAPYSAILPILQRMVGTEADRWFAEQIAYIIGQKFKSKSRPFSLEIDTAAQRAARAIFQTIPDDVYRWSRTACHHYARFYIHILHACREAIQNPTTTQLPQYAVRQLADDALTQAKRLVEQAIQIDDGKEKVSNVINSLAAGIAGLGTAYAEQGEQRLAERHFDDAIVRANNAVAFDAANGHALFNVLDTVIRKFEGNLVQPNEVIDLFMMAEDRFDSLIRLHENRQWQNTGNAEAEYSLSQISGRLQQCAKELLLNRETSTFVARSEIGRVMLKMREILGRASLSEGFRDVQKAEQLRTIRDEFLEAQSKSSRVLVLTYKLFLNDPQGRLDFSRRLDLLEKIEKASEVDYDPYRHDHAALLCQLGAFEAAEDLFKMIRSARDAEPDRWFWVNEKLLIDVQDGMPEPKRHVLRVTDIRQGWGNLGKTNFRVKVQTRQFGNVKERDLLPVFIRFRISGLQAVDERLARQDFEAMGFDPSKADWQL
ncbi:hypothetical protein TSO5_08855 [Azospirillum sp. TSO5]|nr:hypothetical protein TSO5_08855 [Azospirillum sp. TSO5]